MLMYIYQNSSWPKFTWDDKSLLVPLGKGRNLQGKLLGKMESIGFSLQEEAMLELITIDIVKSNEIEGNILDSEYVRSSVARRLGMDISGLLPTDRYIDSVVEMILDATQNYERPITKKRLFNWHSALFPTGRSGMKIITVADWRKDENGPMQVVSGPMGKEKVHYQAPAASELEKEMAQFISWFNGESSYSGITDELDPVIKSGLAHLWFITIHPFGDGNGRIARAIADMQLARADRTNQRFYSMSAQIERRKKSYYDILENTQKGSMDITGWLLWFLQCFIEALEATEEALDKVFTKAKFWEKHKTTVISERQKLMINKLLDDFLGKLNTSKWAKITKCSQDTALRDIQDLMTKGILVKLPGSGRSTNYILNV
ncbi:MAG: Fic family protein [Bacteroidetes bacterium]|nr:Fic family protein [Bacteroidota bacterium]MBU1680907.1 Fic family protein [Bacteroidota bacterium]